jgi:hypothetical protein
MNNSHGHRRNRTPITDADLEAIADEVERGYHVDTFRRRRRGGRPPLGSAAARVESCGWTRNVLAGQLTRSPGAAKPVSHRLRVLEA